MKKNKKNLKFKKLIICIILLIFIGIIFNYLLIEFAKNSNINSSVPQYISNYKIIKQDYNENYSGIGQQKIENEDGYFTTFTTIDKKIYKEYKQNGSSSWSEKYYWGGNMSEKRLRYNSNINYSKWI